MPIAQLGEDILSIKANFVEDFSSNAVILSKSKILEELKNEACVIGLAAQQVYQPLALFYAKLTCMDGFIINPTILNQSAEVSGFWERCMSAFGIHVWVERPVSISVEYYCERGKKHTIELSGFDARLFQHEYDHLLGLMHLDRIPEGQRCSKYIVSALETERRLKVNPDARQKYSL